MILSRAEMFFYEKISFRKDENGERECRIGGS